MDLQNSREIEIKERLRLVLHLLQLDRLLVSQNRLKLSEIFGTWRYAMPVAARPTSAPMVSNLPRSQCDVDVQDVQVVSRAPEVWADVAVGGRPANWAAAWALLKGMLAASPALPLKTGLFQYMHGLHCLRWLRSLRCLRCVLCLC